MTLRKPICRSGRVLTVIVVSALSLIIAGCGFVKADKESEAVIARHFQETATNGFESAMADYGPQFFQKMPREKWIKMLTSVNRKLGKYQSYTVTNWRINQNFGTTGAGTTVVIQCQVTYSRHSDTENFTLFKGVGERDYKIVGHFINSTDMMMN